MSSINILGLRIFIFSLFLSGLAACSNSQQSEESAATAHKLPETETQAAPDTSKPSESLPVPSADAINPSEAPIAPGKGLAKSETPTAKKQAPSTPEKGEVAPVEATKAQVAPLHHTWDQLLQRYVSANGKVNYKGFKTEGAGELEAYLKVLAAQTPQSNWSKAEKMAYWINAYNAFTIQLILEHYPIKSIMDIHKGKPWDVSWIKLGEKNYSLNQIENDILRPQYQDARIHFALNCAARSCPPLLNRAWTAANLERNLELRSRLFINDSSFNRIEANSVKLSKLFDWYSADFGELKAFINRYADTPASATAKIDYFEYDWSLNE